jgi:regulation of enolase protein 1 (concanavalin A-like superfamily)
MRAEEYKAGHGVEAYFSVHKYPNGRLKTATRPDRKTMNESAYLRLVRKGKTIAGSYSFDGKKWIELDSFEARPGTPKVGVFARNASEDRFTASFDHYSLTQPKK